MNKITFDQFLRANGLPSVGEIVTTPYGERLEIIGYTFDVMEDSASVKAIDEDWAPVRWQFCQLEECTWEGKE